MNAAEPDPVRWVFVRTPNRISYPYPREAPSPSPSSEGKIMRTLDVAMDIKTIVETLAAGLTPLCASQIATLGIGGPLDPHRGKSVRVVASLDDLGEGELAQAISGTGDARVLQCIADRGNTTDPDKLRMHAHLFGEKFREPWAWDLIPVAATRRLAEIRSGQRRESERKSEDLFDDDVRYDLGEV